MSLRSKPPEVDFHWKTEACCVVCMGLGAPTGLSPFSMQAMPTDYWWEHSIHAVPSGARPGNNQSSEPGLHGELLISGAERNLRQRTRSGGLERSDSNRSHESPLFMPVFHSDLRKSRIKSGENACIGACQCNIPKECTEKVRIFRRKCSHFKEERWQQA
ncbi:MAG TPA: hypothetical protein VFQ41_04215 [Candidatus Angelobacter sp.]|nr:hypothetical protein [Candidatus Angelobacter sp.]